jgi:hypothetical protein
MSEKYGIITTQITNDKETVNKIEMKGIND